MTKFATIILAMSMGIVGIVCVHPTPVAAFTQIGEDMGKCKQNGYKDKMCACKDSACAQRSDTSAKQGKPKPVAKIDGVKGESMDSKHPETIEMRKSGHDAPDLAKLAKPAGQLKTH